MSKKESKKAFSLFLSSLQRTFDNVSHGRTLSKEYFANNWKRIAIIIVLMLVYINNRYNCQNKLAEINKLKIELTNAKYEALTRSSKLMMDSRQSEVEKQVEQRNLGLEISACPPYKLK